MQGAWIEIVRQRFHQCKSNVAPHAGSVDWNSPRPLITWKIARRSPCRERGLKYTLRHFVRKSRLSLPMQGAWIEIPNMSVPLSASTLSLPMQGAWIEMLLSCHKNQNRHVAPHAGSVDWNVMFDWRRNRHKSSLPMQGAWIESEIKSSNSAAAGVHFYRRKCLTSPPRGVLRRRHIQAETEVLCLSIDCTSVT